MRDKNSKSGLLKYNLRRNKWNILIVSAIVLLFIIVSIGIYLFFSDRNADINNFKDKDLDKINAASQVMFYKDDGSFELVKLATKETIDTYQINGFSKEFVVNRTTDFSGFVVFDPNDDSIYKICAEKGKIQKDILLSFGKDTTVSAITCSGKDNYFSYSSDNVVTTYNDKIQVESEKYLNVNQLYLDKDTLIVVTNSGLYLSSFNTDTSNKMILNSKVENIQFSKDKLYVFNEFGKNNNFSLVFEVNKYDLLVTNTFKIDENDLSVLVTNNLSDKIYFSSDNTFETMTSGTNSNDFKTIDLPTTLSSNAIFNQDVLYTSKTNFYLIVNGRPYYGIDKSCSDFALIYDEKYYKSLDSDEFTNEDLGKEESSAKTNSTDETSN